MDDLKSKYEKHRDEKEKFIKKCENIENKNKNLSIENNKLKLDLKNEKNLNKPKKSKEIPTQTP